VLGAGSGLVALAVLNLWQAVRDADARAALEAQNAAWTMAASAATALRAPAMVDALPAELRFEREKGRVVVPGFVGWLDAPPDWGPFPPFGLEVAERLDEAAQLEYSGQEAAASELLRDLLGSDRLPEQERRRVALRAAWLSHRAGVPLQRDTLLTEVGRARGRLAVSVALLNAAAFGALPPPIEDELARMPVDEAPALLERLGEQGVDTAGLAERLRRVGRQRHVLRLAAEVLDGPGMPPPSSGPIVVGGGLLIYHPEDRFRGRGAWADAPTLAAALTGPAPAELPRVVDGGELVVSAGEALPSDAFVVVPGLLGVLPVPVAASFWSRPGVLGGTVIGLALLFGAGLTFSLRAARREADAQAARAEFLTVVTHELKTPLASIRLLAEMLEDQRVTPDRVTEYYGLLWSESARLTMLIENVLDLGRMDRGERAYDLRGQAVEEIVAEGVALIRPLAARDGMVMDVRLADPWAWADVDRGAFLPALLNVLDNARKYASDGRRIEVATAPGEHGHEVTVRDFGPGVPPEEREGVFLRFKRGRAHLDGSVPGVGLGLYLSRAILRRHGGDLRCEAPDEGPGALFRFVLPVAERQPVLAQRRRPPEAAK